MHLIVYLRFQKLSQLIAFEKFVIGMCVFLFVCLLGVLQLFVCFRCLLFDIIFGSKNYISEVTDGTWQRVCCSVCSLTCISIIINWLISISNFVQCLITLRSRFFSQSMMCAHTEFGFFNFKTLFSISLFSIVLNDKLFARACAASYGTYLIWQKKIDHRNINRHHHKQFAYDWCTNVWRLDGCHWDGANNLNAMEYWSKR